MFQVLRKTTVNQERKKKRKTTVNKEGKKDYSKSGMKGRRQCFINLCKQRKTSMFQVKRKTTMF